MKYSGTILFAQRKISFAKRAQNRRQPHLPRVLDDPLPRGNVLLERVASIFRRLFAFRDGLLFALALLGVFGSELKSLQLGRYSGSLDLVDVFWGQKSISEVFEFSTSDARRPLLF